MGIKTGRNWGLATKRHHLAINQVLPPPCVLNILKQSKVINLLITLLRFSFIVRLGLFSVIISVRLSKILNDQQMHQSVKRL